MCLINWMTYLSRFSIKVLKSPSGYILPLIIGGQRSIVGRIVKQKKEAGLDGFENCKPSKLKTMPTFRALLREYLIQKLPEKCGLEKKLRVKLQIVLLRPQKDITCFLRV